MGTQKEKGSIDQSSSLDLNKKITENTGYSIKKKIKLYVSLFYRTPYVVENHYK